MRFRWRKWNNILHRDLGYLFVGMTIIYGLSGIALNHLGDWNPSYIIKSDSVQIEAESLEARIDKTTAKELLRNLAIEEKYKSHYSPGNNQLKIFFKNGSLTANTKSGEGRIETIKRRPIFYEFNLMHYNPGKWWTWYSDIFSASLILLAITGMFVLRGRKGIRGRGAVLVTIGILIPLIFILAYI